MTMKLIITSSIGKAAFNNIGLGAQECKGFQLITLFNPSEKEISDNRKETEKVSQSSKDTKIWDSSHGKKVLLQEEERTKWTSFKLLKIPEEKGIYTVGLPLTNISTRA